jgi:hypothetical protein
MSLRRRQNEASQAEQIRSELGDLEKVARQIDRDANVEASGASKINMSAEFEKLTATEQSAASLGVNPNEFRPIQFMNNGHYENLRANNMLDGDLARRIQAFKMLSTQ